MEKRVILIVDDDRIFAEALELLLTDKGYAVVMAGNGKEMTIEVKEKIPDLILMDYKLPDMTGIEWLERLKQDKRTAGVPVIMVSASNNIEKMAKEAGADSFLAKPFGTEVLMDTIRRCI